MWSGVGEASLEEPDTIDLPALSQDPGGHLSLRGEHNLTTTHGRGAG